MQSRSWYEMEKALKRAAESPDSKAAKRRLAQQQKKDKRKAPA